MKLRMAFLRRLILVALLVMLLELTQKVFVLNRLVEADMSREATSLEKWVVVPNSRHPEPPPSKKTQISIGVRGGATNDRRQRKDTIIFKEKVITPTDDICQTPPGQGSEGRLGLQALTKIKVNTEKNSKRFLCIVLTDSTHHAGALRAITETYAPRCDGFLAASNASDPSVGAVAVWNNGDSELVRVQRVWTYVRNNDRFLEEFDAFHLGGEDMYVIPENLRALLSQLPNQKEPLYLGGAVVPSRKTPEERYCGGGAGYTLDSRSVQILVDIMMRNGVATDSVKPADQQVADWFRSAGIQCRRSVDSDSALRYLEFGIDYQAQWNRAMSGPIKYNPLKEYHRIYMRPGESGVSDSAVSIHLVHGLEPLNASTAEAIRRIHAILHGQCAEKPSRSLGALDENGNPGYVHDATFLRSHPPALDYAPKDADYPICESPFGQGIEGEKGYQGLKKIKIMNDTPDRKKVMCIVYTHSNRHNRVRAIAETYAPKCDGFLAASNLTDPSIGAVNLLHEGPELYQNMWLKVRAIWQYVYENYANDFDFFQIGGDDHYVIPENLRYLVSTGSWKGPWNQSQPLYLGSSVLDFPRTDSRYCGGGAGYTLNRVALKLLVEELLDTHHCKPHLQASDEDRIIGKCFRSVGISCMDTNDDLQETRYHGSRVDFHAKWRKSDPAPWRPIPLEKFHGIVNKEGLGQISETSVTFHLKGKRVGFEDRGMRRYHAILYGLCDNKPS